MSRKPEQRLWDRIRKNVPRAVHIERLENSAGWGTPDTVVIHAGNVLFVEHKVALAPAKLITRVQWKHPLTPEQRNWHRNWHQHGGRSSIVIGIGLDIHAVPGHMVDRITDMPYAAMMAWRVNYQQLTKLYKGIVKQ